MNDYFQGKKSMKLNRHIYLLGFMGSGKTFLAKKIGQELNIPFYDLDQEIEKYYNNSIESIFKVKGEDFFRALESKMLKSLISFSPGIVSLGGGTPCFNNNINFLNSVGITIFIDTTSELICSRLQKDKSNRPLLKEVKKNPEKLIEFIDNKLAERKPIYQQANFIVQQTFENQKYIAKDIFEIIKSIS